MFEISWGEIFVVGAVGVAVTGRRDLPAACRFVGSQLGRVVGLLQGARARADQYAAQNELRQLQNELRSGLRELDQVRTELAVAASSQGIVGRTLGATTPSANRAIQNLRPSLPGGGSPMASGPMAMTSGMSSLLDPSSNPAANAGKSEGSSADETRTVAFDLPAPSQKRSLPVASLASHSEKAALEDEWEKQGIGYQTRAEQMYKRQMSQISGPASGSQLLEGLIKQNLMWDQYDRVAGEQDAQLHERIEAMKAKRQEKDKDK